MTSSTPSSAACSTMDSNAGIAVSPPSSEKRFSPMAALKVSRLQASAAVVCGHLYVTGGLALEPDDSEDDEKERVITHDEEHEPHTKPQPSIPSPRRQDVSSDINFDDFEDVMVPSKLMDDVDLSHDDYGTTIQDEDTAIKHAAEAATRAASHASKLSERALSDVEDLIAIKSTTQKKQEEKSTSSSKPKQTNAQPKCLRNSDCRCEQCVMSLQGQNFFAEMERLRM